MKRIFVVFLLGAGGLWCKAQSNALPERVWDPLMRKAMEWVTMQYDNAYYKGQLSDGMHSGLGVYLWADGSWYWGQWKEGDMNGKALYIAPEGHPDTGCPDCAYYVGDYRSDKKAGTGTCYDKYGKLLYRGGFSSGRPTDVYPSARHPECIFTCLEYGGGDMYLGEMKDGVRHGYGIYLRSDGGAWYGQWENDKREGEGVFLSYVGEILTGRWKAGVYEKWQDTDAPHGGAGNSGNGESDDEVYDRAVECYESGNYSKAAQLVRSLAGKGYVKAQFFLADSYEKGEGVARDGNKALYWYKKVLKSRQADETMQFFAKERIALLEKRGYSATRAGIE